MSLILIANNQTFTRSGRRILERHNGCADYRVRVYLNDCPIWDGSITNHKRSLGATSLIAKVSKEMKRGRAKK